MNTELIRYNLSILEKESEAQRTPEACTAAFSVIRLIISQVKPLIDENPKDEEKLRTVCRSLSGVLNEMNMLLAAAEPSYVLALLSQKNEEKIRKTREQYTKFCQEFEQEEERNAVLLAEEEKLRESVKKLSDLKNKTAELIRIKETEIHSLQEEIDRDKLKLEELEKTYCECRLIKEEYQAKLGEDSDIIKCMPKSVGVRTIDDLIAYGKRFIAEENKRKDETEKCIYDIIAAIDCLSKKTSEASL